MGLAAKLKNHFFNAFRELFIYHHSSLEFRASMFALIIAANENAGEFEFEIVTEAGMTIYNDKDRANSLTLTTKEYVQKVRDDNGLDIDILVHKIVKELKVIPRYYKKIDISQLKPILACNNDEETHLYQQRMLEFLAQTKKDYER
ncbi:MAG: hypothetical protein U9Q62_02790 [Campylobacterota bacterium]|nr:hypothetical protein [Campylobacterota bacterium]